MRILCVDDDAFVREALYFRGLTKKLKNDTILTAESGEEAINEIKKQKFDIVISDLKMPGLSGLDVLKYVKKNSFTTEVIIVTGVASIQSAVEAIRYGARDYIEKPISLELLIEKVENIRDFKKLYAEAEEYRLAKEICEAEADLEIHTLELSNQDLRTGIKIALEQLKRIGSSSSEIEQVIATLEPLITLPLTEESAPESEQ